MSMDRESHYRADRLHPAGGAVYGVRMNYISKDHSLIGRWSEPLSPGRNTAECKHPPLLGPSPLHSAKVPYRRCPSGCGYWAAWAGTVWEPAPPAPYMVCLVVGTGKLLGGDEGWIAEHIRVLAVSRVMYGYSWPPGVPPSAVWVLSSDSRLGSGPQVALSTEPLSAMGQQVAEKYGVPILSRVGISGTAKSLTNADAGITDFIESLTR